VYRSSSSCSSERTMIALQQVVLTFSSSPPRARRGYAAAWRSGRPRTATH